MASTAPMGHPVYYIHICGLCRITVVNRTNIYRLQVASSITRRWGTARGCCDVRIKLFANIKKTHLQIYIGSLQIGVMMCSALTGAQSRANQHRNSKQHSTTTYTHTRTHPTGIRYRLYVCKCIYVYTFLLFAWHFCGVRVVGGAAHCSRVAVAIRQPVCVFALLVYWRVVVPLFRILLSPHL